MISFFRPDYYIKTFEQLNPELLVQKGIRLLICDIDNTLVAHDDANPNEDVRHFVRKLKEKGIEFILISNNTIGRTKVFAEQLGVPAYGFAKKPLKWTYRKILNDYHCKASEVASLGDQLLTDVCGSKRMKLFTILTDPLYQRDGTHTKLNRKIENQLFRSLEARKYLIRGQYNG
jgi:HAD superfamily (subfamily IIIA) phosphatase, TIGR01668